VLKIVSEPFQPGDQGGSNLLLSEGFKGHFQRKSGKGDIGKVIAVEKPKEVSERVVMKARLNHEGSRWILLLGQRQSFLYNEK
jgi:hypothetical protein